VIRRFFVSPFKGTLKITDAVLCDTNFTVGNEKSDLAGHKSILKRAIAVTFLFHCPEKFVSKKIFFKKRE